MRCFGGRERKTRQLFELLDRHGLGFVTFGDFDFLEKWKPPPYIFAKPDNPGLRRMKEALWEAHQSPLKAWRKTLDPDGTMRASWDEFRQACLDLSQSSSAESAVPQTDEDIASAWRALDKDCSGWIALLEFDRQSFEAVATFKRWADKTYGNVLRAFRSLEHANGRVSWEQMLKLKKKHKELSEHCLEIVFDGLDLNNTWFLTETDVRFLDNWDLAWEDWHWEAAVKKRGGSAVG